MNRTRTMVGAACWIGTVVFFVGQAIAQAGVAMPYDMINNYVSDLGAVGCRTVSIGLYHADVCSPRHAFMNGGFALTGIGIILGTVLLRPVFPAGRLRSWGIVLLILGGAGKLIAGLAPEDLHPLAHMFGGVLSIPATFGILLLAGSLRSTDMWLSRFGTACAVVGLVGLVLSGLASQRILLGVGLAERIDAYPAIIWTIGAGLVLVTRLRVRGSVSGTRPSVRREQIRDRH